MAADAEIEPDDMPEDEQKRWDAELKASRKWLAKCHRRGMEIVRRYLDDRTSMDESSGVDTGYRLNAYSANVQTQEAMMYGRVPTVDVSRRFADAGDDVARVAGELLERLLNCDIERANDSYRHVLGYALGDRMRPGIAVARVRYEVEFDETDEAEAEADQQNAGEEQGEEEAQLPKQSEDAVVDYVYWKDFLYSPCRTWHNARWAAFKAEMPRRALVKRFGKKKGNSIPLNSKRSSQSGSQSSSEPDEDAQKTNPRATADVWEIWDKETEDVLWFVEGAPDILDRKHDPLGLCNFFPCPRPMIANPTTTAFRPTPDFHLARDIYDEIDDVSQRIRLLEKAVKVSGGYDDTLPGLAQILDSDGNQLIPIPNWPAYQEKGGIASRIEWVPLEMVVLALDKLRDFRSELLSLLYQQTGMSDIVRGQQAENGTPGEAQVKARFASVRMQSLQDEFARFASELQCLRAEVIANLFDVETILARSNAQYLPEADRGLAEQAALLIKDKVANYRIEVKPESVSMEDFAQMKAEGLEVLEAIGNFLQMAQGLVQATPGSLPFLLQMLQAVVAKLKGSKQLEGILDQAIQAAEQAQQQQAANPQLPPPDPKLEAAKVKGQLDMQKEQQKLQSDLTRIDAETQANNQRQKDQTFWNVTEQQARARIKQSQQPGPPVVPGPSGGAP